ncbi:hypothetical protein B0H13DRAFT_1889059 [Mycena leptocephala]|nr:hypothetical protein B0H13DRAFT_1889059 [Mycena leptocephala]
MTMHKREVLQSGKLGCRDDPIDHRPIQQRRVQAGIHPGLERDEFDVQLVKIRRECVPPRNWFVENETVRSKCCSVVRRAAAEPQFREEQQGPHEISQNVERQMGWETQVQPCEGGAGQSQIAGCGSSMRSSLRYRQFWSGLICCSETQGTCNTRLKWSVRTSGNMGMDAESMKWKNGWAVLWSVLERHHIVEDQFHQFLGEVPHE